MKLYTRRKRTPPPNVLLVPDNKDRSHRNDLASKYHSYRQQTHHPPHMVGLHVSNLDLHDTSSSSFGWQQYSHKNPRISLAPDIVYRNTYLGEKKQEKSDRNNKQEHLPSLRLKVSNSFSSIPSEPLTRKHYTHPPYQTIYDYIRESIRQIERQRNLKKENFSFRIRRPLNENTTLRRVLGEKKTSLSRSSSTTTQTKSSLFNNNLKDPQSLVNYINHSHVLNSTTSNQSYEQQSSVIFQN